MRNGEKTDPISGVFEFAADSAKRFDQILELLNVA
ncbi:MAG: hypothetical protein XD72_2355 [Methanothrix harundinacea]|jgi:hypothetical protein|uniref:Uncharacterized protein n=1 Tax=Methanothrix harundinacea TaxID=301375 RepID=A0A101FS04_9EURY|nr:MAG: hypothetical protein XD72_2355 [Methanothrix harundinacea]